MLEQGAHAVAGHHHLIEAIIEAALKRDEQRFGKTKMVIARIGFEPRMVRGNDGCATLARPGDGAMADDIRRGHMHDIGIEALEISTDIRAQALTKPIFAATAGHAPAGDRDEIAGRLESGFLDRRGIDAHGRACAQSRSDKAVESLIGAVADVIIIAAEERNAEVCHCHRAPIATHPALRKGGGTPQPHVFPDGCHSATLLSRTVSIFEAIL